MPGWKTPPGKARWRRRASGISSTWRLLANAMRRDPCCGRARHAEVNRACAVRRRAVGQRRRLGLVVRRADDVTAGLLVAFKLQQVPGARLLEQLVERAEAVVALVEAGIAALQRLLDHRAPDLLLVAALVDQGVDRLEHELEGFLLLVRASIRLGRGPGRRCLRFGLLL